MAAEAKQAVEAAVEAKETKTTTNTKIGSPSTFQRCRPSKMMCLNAVPLHQPLSLKSQTRQLTKYIHREGTKEPSLIAQALEADTAHTIEVPPPPLQIQDPNNAGAMIDDQAGLFMWQSSLKQVPIC